MKPLLVVSTVAPPIVAVLRLPAVTAAGLPVLVLVLLPPAAEVPDELHAARIAAVAAMAGSISSIRRPFRAFGRVSDLIIASSPSFLDRPGPLRRGGTLTFPLWVYGAVKVGIPPQVVVIGTLIFAGGVLLAVTNLVLQRKKA